MHQIIPGKVVVITGSSRLLGDATARLLSSAGAIAFLAAQRSDRRAGGHFRSDRAICHQRTGQRRRQRNSFPTDRSACLIAT